jgi:hypothetical protein
MKKGKRYPNHSLEEKTHLLIIAHKYQHVISNQIGLDLMKKCWQKIAAEKSNIY